MPRFVLHKHSGHGPTHWDLMLETGEKLATWQSDCCPTSSPLPMPMQKIFDHRSFYLDYEGEISGNRGRIERIDTGLLEILEQSPHYLQFTLAGALLKGTFELTCNPASPDSWTLRLKD